VIYGLGAALGYTPQEVNAMSMWQWQAALNGFVEANTPKESAKLSESEADELFAWIDTPNAAGPLTSPTYVFDDVGRLVPAGIVTFSLH
jgi:hypothetical protein